MASENDFGVNQRLVPNLVLRKFLTFNSKAGGWTSVFGSGKKSIRTFWSIKAYMFVWEFWSPKHFMTFDWNCLSPKKQRQTVRWAHAFCVWLPGSRQQHHVLPSRHGTLWLLPTDWEGRTGRQLDGHASCLWNGSRDLQVKATDQIGQGFYSSVRSKRRWLAFETEKLWPDAPRVWVTFSRAEVRKTMENPTASWQSKP